MLKYALVASLLVGASASYGQTTPSDKTADIRKLLGMTGANSLGRQVMEQLVASFKTSFPQVPAKFWNDFLKQANADEMVNRIIPIYDKYFSSEDVKSLINFYETPVGKKFITVLPQLTQESMKAGQLWGREITDTLLKKIQAQQPALPASKN